MSTMSGLRNVTFDDRDQNNLRYQGFWFLIGSWNASSVGETGTLSSTNDPNANVTFTFPTPAVAFYYYGIMRSHGGRYGICIDCDPNNRIFIPIDGLNATDDGHNPPVVLFSQNFLVPGVHEVILRNEEDTRFPNGNSQLTVDQFVLEVIDPSGVSASSSSLTTAAPTASSSSSSQSISFSGSSSSSTSASTQLGSTPLSSQSSSSIFPSPTTAVPPSTETTTPSASSASAVLSSPAPIGAIVGGVLGGLALVLSLLLLLFWLRIRRRKATAILSAQPQHHVHGSSGPSINTYSSSARSGKGMVQVPDVQRRYQPMFKPQLSTSTHPDATSPTTNNLSTTSAPAPSSTHSSSTQSGVPRPQRERDAGPVLLPEEETDLGDTLPPEYSSVFVTRRSMVRRTARY